MGNVTRWNPDTCECVLDYEVDPLDPNKVIFKEPVNICEFHKDIAEMQQVVLGENQTKNRVIGLIHETFGIAPETIGFSFNEDRHLTLVIPKTIRVTLIGVQKAIDAEYEGVTVENG